MGIAKKGDNSLSKEHLKSVIERIENLEEEKSGIASDIKDIYTEAAGTGFDKKTIRKVIRLRKIDAAQREEEKFLLETYCKALGMGILE